MDRKQRKEIKELLNDMEKDRKKTSEIIVSSKNFLEETNAFIKEYNDLVGEKNEYILDLDPDYSNFSKIINCRERYFYDLVSMSDLLKDIETKIEKLKIMLREG